MKKKVAALVLACAMTAVMLAGCGNKENAELFGYTPSGKSTLVPGDKFDAKDLGMLETESYMEAASCYYNGMDKIFYYDGYDVTTYPAADGDYIQDISINSESIKTSKGVGVGSSFADVTKAYGEDYQLAGKMYKYYEDDSKYLYFFIMNDVVKYYGYAIEVR